MVNGGLGQPDPPFSFHRGTMRAVGHYPFQGEPCRTIRSDRNAADLLNAYNLATTRPRSALRTRCSRSSPKARSARV